ncbi:MAG: hypothetical protein AAF645_25600 [Myxococcota bacterium]
MNPFKTLITFSPLLLLLASGCSKEIPESWRSLGLPQLELAEIGEGTVYNDQRINLDYEGITAMPQLCESFREAIEGHGYQFERNHPLAAASPTSVVYVVSNDQEEIRISCAAAADKTLVSLTRSPTSD